MIPYFIQQLRQPRHDPTEHVRVGPDPAMSITLSESGETWRPGPGMHACRSISDDVHDDPQHPYLGSDTQRNEMQRPPHSPHSHTTRNAYGVHR